jgi:hypothetical protein
MRRIDSGAIGGSGLDTITQGFDGLVSRYFTNSTTLGSIGSNPSGVFLLNYVSQKHAEGDGVHNHTTYWLNRPYTSVTLGYRYQYAPTITPDIPETNYYVSCNCYNVFLQTGGSAASTLYYSFQAEKYDGVNANGGWEELHSSNYYTDAEIGPSITWVRAGDPFKRFPNDPLSDMSLETVRDYKFETQPNNAHFQVLQMVTYASKTYVYSGTYSNAPAGDTVIIRAYAQRLGGQYSQIYQLMDTGSAGSGSFTFPWFYNASGSISEGEVEIVCYHADAAPEEYLSYVGPVNASIDFDFAATGGGGPTYYSYG